MCSTGQLLCHLGERAGQPTQLVLALQHRLGRQIACGHLAHALGQQQQRAGQLVAQQHGQDHRTKDGEKQAERQCADVHPPQATPGQRTLLVFAVGLSHEDGIGHQGRWQRLCDLQEA